MGVWKAEPTVQISVLLSSAGPFDLFGAPFVDITQFVMGGGITISRGRSDEFDHFQAGSCSLTLKNDHREFDPNFPASPILQALGATDTIDAGDSVLPVDVIDAGASGGSPVDIFDSMATPGALKPLRRLQVVVTYAGVDHTIFVGYVDGWPRTWTNTTGTVSIVAHDLITVMARAVISPSTGVLILDDPFAGQLDVGRLAGDLPQQATGERILSLLQLAGFSRSQFVVTDTGLTQVIPVEPTGNILSLIQEAEFAEAGFFFVDRNGVITFFDRHSRFQKSRLANVQATFSDSQYGDLVVQRDLTQVRNEVKFTRPDGPEQRCTDNASIHDFGVITLEDELPVLSDGETFSRAEFYCARYGQPEDRPDPITIKPRRNMASLFPAVLTRDLLDRVQITRTPLGIGPTDTFTGLIESLEHRISNEDWETTIGISPIDISDGSNFLILDDGTKGQLDEEALAY